MYSPILRQETDLPQIVCRIPKRGCDILDCEPPDKSIVLEATHPASPGSFDHPFQQSISAPRTPHLVPGWELGAGG